MGFLRWFFSLFTKAAPKESAPLPKQVAAPGESQPVLVVAPNPPQPVSPAPAPSTSGPASTTPSGTQGGVVKPANVESTCPAPGVFGAVDLCTYSTQHFLDVMKWLKIGTIIRYYEHPNETLHGKTPTAAELALIKQNGFRMLAVFQHSNNSIATFEAAGRGTRDATRSLELASLWKQPKNSCIYFGVDFDPSLGHEMTAVKYYAKDFGDTVRAAGFLVGTYGSGLTLETLLSAGLIDKTWLSMSTGFQHSKAFEASKKWNLHQVKDRTCGGINVDFNYTNGDIGDWEIA